MNEQRLYSQTVDVHNVNLPVHISLEEMQTVIQEAKKIPESDKNTSSPSFKLSSSDLKEDSRQSLGNLKKILGELPPASSFSTKKSFTEKLESLLDIFTTSSSSTTSIAIPQIEKAGTEESQENVYYIIPFKAPKDSSALNGWYFSLVKRPYGSGSATQGSCASFQKADEYFYFDKNGNFVVVNEPHGFKFFRGSLPSEIDLNHSDEISTEIYGIILPKGPSFKGHLQVEVQGLEKEYIQTLPYISGVTLDKYLQDNPHLSFLDKLYITQAYIEKIKAIHEKGILLVDITPANIIIQKDESISKGNPYKIYPIDFDLAQKENKNGEIPINKIPKTIFQPRPYLTHPENSESQDYHYPADRKSDIFSIGILLIYLFGNKYTEVSDNNKEISKRLTNYYKTEQLHVTAWNSKEFKKYLHKLLEILGYTGGFSSIIAEQTELVIIEHLLMNTLTPDLTCRVEASVLYDILEHAIKSIPEDGSRRDNTVAPVVSAIEEPFKGKNQDYLNTAQSPEKKSQAKICDNSEEKATYKFSNTVTASGGGALLLFAAGLFMVASTTSGILPGLAVTAALAFFILGVSILIEGMHKKYNFFASSSNSQEKSKNTLGISSGS